MVLDYNVRLTIESGINTISADKREAHLHYWNTAYSCLGTCPSVLDSFPGLLCLLFFAGSKDKTDQYVKEL